MRHHARRGQPFEDVLADLHTLYNRANRASVVRNPAPMKPIGKARGKVFPAVYTSEGPPDYTAQSDGVSFMFDAKSHAGDKWPLAGLPDHQAAHLTAHERHGGYAFVLLRLDSRTYLIPWRVLGPIWRAWSDGRKRGERAANGTASLSSAQLDEVAIRLQSADWLNVAIADARNSRA